MIDRIVRRFLALPTFVRRLIIRSLISAVVLTFWTHVATYVYALRYGARLPLEGVPFLVVFSFVASFVLAAISVTSLALLPFARNAEGSQQSEEVQETAKKSRTERAELVSFITAAIATLASVVGAISALVISAESVVASGALADFVVKLFAGVGSAVSVGVTILLVVAVAIGLLFLLRQATRKQIEAISFGVYIIAGAAIMVVMLGQSFDHLLRVAQYGGGLPVTIQVDSDGGSSGLNDASLFMVSESTVTVWDGRSQQFHQFNTEHVVAILYDQDRTWQMPPERSVGEMLGLDFKKTVPLPESRSSQIR